VLLWPAHRVASVSMPNLTSTVLNTSSHCTRVHLYTRYSRHITLPQCPATSTASSRRCCWCAMREGQGQDRALNPLWPPAICRRDRRLVHSGFKFSSRCSAMSGAAATHEQCAKAKGRALEQADGAPSCVPGMEQEAWAEGVCRGMCVCCS
jgi:hypothetical protein